MLLGRVWRIVRIYAAFFVVAWLVCAAAIASALVVLGGNQTTAAVTTLASVRSGYVGMDGYSLGGTDTAVAAAARYGVLVTSDVFLEEASRDALGAEGDEREFPKVAARSVGTTIEVVVTDADGQRAQAFADALVSLIQKYAEETGPAIEGGSKLLEVVPLTPSVTKVKDSSIVMLAAASLGAGGVVAGAITYLRHLLRRRVIDAADAAAVVEAVPGADDLRVVDLVSSGPLSRLDRLLLDPAVTTSSRIGLIVDDEAVLDELRGILEDADGLVSWSDLGAADSSGGNGAPQVDRPDETTRLVCLPADGVAKALRGGGPVDVLWVAVRSGSDTASNVLVRVRAVSALGRPVRVVVV